MCNIAILSTFIYSYMIMMTYSLGLVYQFLDKKDIEVAELQNL